MAELKPSLKICLVKMTITYDKNYERYIDTDTGIMAKSKNSLRAEIKRDKLKIPEDDFLSNSFVLRKMEG